MGILPFVILLSLIVILLMFLVYYITKAVLTRMGKGSRKSRRWYALIPSVLLASFLILFIYYLTGMTAYTYPRREFQPQQWQTEVWNRYSMTDHIIGSKMLVGKNKSEVEELLGSGYFVPESQGSGYEEIAYFIGNPPGRPMDLPLNTLVIAFENGITVEVYNTFQKVPD